MNKDTSSESEEDVLLKDYFNKNNKKNNLIVRKDCHHKIDIFIKKIDFINKILYGIIILNFFFIFYKFCN